jgi:hypothetical protein
VQDNSPFADTTYHVRFYFNPNGYNTGNGGNPPAVIIFNGLNASNTSIFQIQYRGSNSVRQVRLVVTRAGGTSTTAWINILNNQFNRIEMEWSSGSSTTARLWVGSAAQGSPSATLTGLNTSAYTLESVRLGPQGTLPNSGTVYFDSFVSTRNTYIGP